MPHGWSLAPPRLACRTASAIWPRSRRTGATDPRQTPTLRPASAHLRRRSPGGRTARRAQAERISSPSRLSPTYSDRGDPWPATDSYAPELAARAREITEVELASYAARTAALAGGHASGPGEPAARRPVVASRPTTRTRSSSAARPGGLAWRTSTATTTSTSTWASAPCSPATATRRCGPRSRSSSTTARCSSRRARSTPTSPSCSPSATACRCGASPTPAPRRRWTPSASPGASPGGTRSSRSRAATTATTTR